MADALNIEADWAAREADLKAMGVGDEVIDMLKKAYFNGVLSALDDIARLPCSNERMDQIGEMLEICEKAITPD